MTRNIYFIKKLVRSANDLRRVARRTILLNNRWFFQFLLDDIFHADSLIISNRMSNYVQYARKCSTTYIRESLRAFRSTLQIGHLLLVFKRKRMKRNLRLYRDEKTLLSPCPSLSPALCVLLVRRVACVHPSLIAGKLPSISMSLSFGILASVARSSFFLRLPLIAYRVHGEHVPPFACVSAVAWAICPACTRPPEYTRAQYLRTHARIPAVAATIPAIRAGKH